MINRIHEFGANTSLDDQIKAIINTIDTEDDNMPASVILTSLIPTQDETTAPLIGMLIEYFQVSNLYGATWKQFKDKVMGTMVSET